MFKISVEKLSRQTEIPIFVKSRVLENRKLLQYLVLFGSLKIFSFNSKWRNISFKGYRYIVGRRVYCQIYEQVRTGA